MKIINYILLLVCTLMVASCEPTYEKEYNWAYPVAGDWTVAAYVDGEVVSGYEKFEIKSYNSSFGQDSIWIDDYGTGVASSSQYGNFWTMKFKTAVNMTTKTFQTTNSKNAIPGYPIGIQVKNGKIVGNDSIYFEVIFEDEPTVTFQVAGHRTTSYEEYMGH